MSLRSEIVRIINELLSGSKKITELPTADALTGLEYVEVVQDGFNKKVATANISGGTFDLSGVVQHRGNFSLAANVFPSTGGTGSGGTVEENNRWFITAGSTTLLDENGDPIPAGVFIEAKVDSPSTTSISDWWIIQEGVDEGGVVASVTGDGVDNTDPDNPVLSFPTPGDIGAEAVGVAAALVATEVTNRNAAIVSALEGLKWKDSVTVATTANITLSGEQTIDGILTSASRVLVKNQSTASENGIYVSAAGAWSRSSDANTSAELEGATVPVQRGTSNENTSWTQTADNITLGSTSLSFSQLGTSVPDASETVKGIIEIATQVETNTGTDDVRALTPLKAATRYAPLVSPTFTGTPAAPTAVPGTNTTQVATTAFVAAGLATVSGYTSTAPEVIYAVVTGQTMKGRILTAQYSYRDIDGTAQGTSTFQWVRADDAIGTGAADIVGATSSTYALVTGDLTKYIACKITPVNVTPESGSVYTTAYVGAVDDTYYPADQSNVVISYGVKKMAAAYAGNCIRVQNTNGGATQNIGFDGNGDLDWAAVASFSGGGNTTLSIWYDQSGNGFNMTFAAFANQPAVNPVEKRIEWAPTNSGITTHNATMNIGTGDFSLFMEATQKILKDTTFSFVTKKTSFSANNLQLYSPAGVGILLYTGNASTNTLSANYATPERRSVISAYRNSTTKFINTDGVVKSAAETATDLTSTVDITYNAGDGGAGDWYMWSFTMYKTNYGADYSKYKKYVSI